MMIQKRTLHILNGMAMYNFYKKTGFLGNELMIPFNEAMCYGNTCDELFSDEFINIRAKVHHVTPAQYAEITLSPLQPLFYEDFNRIVLWFDEDMFCQINILTLLAWLDRTEYKGAIDLQLVGDHFQPMDSFDLKPDGYYAIYNQVLIHKKNPQDVLPSPLKKGIELYLNYRRKDSDLIMYIEEHRDAPIKKLVPKLIENFKKYGLGDTQYLEIINTYRGTEGQVP